MPVLPWLEKLLNTAFFTVCRTHGDAARSECNMYCLDCNCAFCFYCRSSKHKDHQVIQIRRSSYHGVVRVSEIQSDLSQEFQFNKKATGTRRDASSTLNNPLGLTAQDAYTKNYVVPLETISGNPNRDNCVVKHPYLVIVQ